MKIKKRMFCLLLTLFVLITAVFSISAYTTDDITQAAHDLIFSHEGIHTTVLADDNGAVSIGKIGWHGRRALHLLQCIADLNPEQAEEILGEELYMEILVSEDEQWDTRIFTQEEKEKVQAFLATDESKTFQDEHAMADIKSYIVHGQTMGMTDGKVLVFFADLENQMGQLGAENVVEIAIEAKGTVTEITLDDIYEASMADSLAASSPLRRKSAYDYCSTLEFGEQGFARVFKPGEYVTVASALRVRSGPGTTFDPVTDPILKGTEVTVTEVSGDWGKIEIDGVTGWINLLYTARADKLNDTEEESSDDVSEELTEPQVLIPDFNGNGRVDASDARSILRVAANLDEFTAEEAKRADMNSDGKITAGDARTVLRIAAKLQ